MKKILILGAGIQGVCCALALHDEGYDVTLIESSPHIFEKTSRNQEGRVHMGFTYGLDKTDKTGEMMMHSALQFSAAMERWLGRIDWDEYLLDEGYYAVHKTSLMSVEEIVKYYERLQAIHNHLLSKDENLSYFGKRHKEIFTVLPTLPPQFSDRHISRVISTVERIVEMFKFRDLLIQNIESRNITVKTSTEVIGVGRKSRGFLVQTKSLQKKVVFEGDIVVNCLWNNRIKIDKTINVPTLDDPLYRFKIGIFGKVKKRVPNCSIIAGAYGNISPRMDGTYAYISWHADCMRDMTTDGTTPKAWEDFFRNYPKSELAMPWVGHSVEMMSEIIPDAATFTPIELLPGIICSTGKTDIQDKNSDVHKRASQMGIGEYDQYFTINTGKFSSAPLLANELVERIKRKNCGQKQGS